MKKQLQVIATLIVAIMTISCHKDNLYVAQSDDKISSMIIISGDYSSGIPAIQMNDSYTYTYDHIFDSTSGVLNSTFSSGVSDINIKVNPSNASLDDVSWQLVRRSATTKVMDNEEIYPGELTVTRSETETECVTLSVDGSQNEFFSLNQDYVYSVVAIYEDGTEVSSDVACLKVGSTVELQSIFMGQVIDGVVVNYSDNFKMTSNSMTLEAPVMYGLLPSGEAMTFDQMGIDDNQYTLYSTESFAGMTTNTIAVSSSQSDDSEDSDTLLWEFTVHDRLQGYNYNEFNGYIGLQYELYDSSGVLISLLYSTIYTEMDDIELTKSTIISNDVSPFSFSVLCNNLDYDYLDRILMLYPYVYEPYTDFTYNYCNDNFETGGVANTPKFYINDVESSEVIFDYSDPSNIKLTLNNPLSVGVYQIKVVLSSQNYATTITETTTLTVL